MAVTNKQKHAVRFIIETLRIPFKGNIKDNNDVHQFLSEHLEDAKLLKKQLDDIAEFWDEQNAMYEMALDSRIAEQEHLW